MLMLTISVPTGQTYNIDMSISTRRTLMLMPQPSYACVVSEAWLKRLEVILLKD